MQCPREKISKTGRLVISEQGIPGIAVDVGGVLGMADHTDVLGVIMFIEEGHNGMERDAGGLGQGITEDAGRDGGKIDGGDVVLFRETQAGAVAGRQQSRLPRAAALPDGTGGMDDVFRLEVIAPGKFGLTGFTAAEGSAFGEEFRTGGMMDRSVHAAAAQKGAIGGVDDALRVGLCDIADDNGKAVHKTHPLS